MSVSVYAQVEALLDQLAPDEQLRLIEEIARRLRGATAPGATAEPKALYGAALGAEALDLDVERAMREMPPEWLQGLEPREETP